MANNLLSPCGCLAHEGMVPSKTKYVGLWLWDSALHALAFRHIDSHWRKTNCAPCWPINCPTACCRTPSTTKA
jgi:hypothetical protein